MKQQILRLQTMEPINVAIAEDHKVFRKGIILSMKPYPHINFVIEAGNGQELIDQLPVGVMPQVVLMDIRMPGMDGIEATKYLSKNHPMLHIICLTMFEDRQFVDEMMASGARAYLLKNAEPQEINAAIIEVMSGTSQNTARPNQVLFSKSIINNSHPRL